jgi:hypothetical protein
MAGEERGIIELNAHDVTRIWQLALVIYDGDDEDADLRNYFAQALNVYMEFMQDLGDGGIVFEDEDESLEFVSEREVKSDQDVVRFRVRAKEKPPVVEKAPKAEKGDKAKGKKKKS